MMGGFMQWLRLILNWIKNLFVVDFKSIHIRAAVHGDTFYLEDYMPCFGTSPKVSWRKIIVDLNRFVLHLWHAPVVQKARDYVVWSTRETFIQLPKGVISWVVPRKIVITEIEVVGHLDVVHHGNVHDPIVHAELRLKHGLEKKTIKRKADYIFNYRYWGGEVWGKPVVYDKTPRGKRKGRKGEFDHVGVSKTLWPTEGWLETLYYEVEVKKRNRRKIRVSSWDLSPEEAMEEELIQKTDKFHLKMCNLRWKMNCHENRKTMRRKEERRAKVSYRNSALSGLWAEEAHC